MKGVNRMEFAKRAAIEGRILDIVNHDMYANNKELYANTSTAIEVDIDGKQYALPYRNGQTNQKYVDPGVYDAGCVYFVVPPSPSQEREYLLENLNVIDYQNTNNLSDFLNTQKQLRNIEEELLTDIDDIFCPTIGPNDTAEMKALKQAVAAKQCDFNKYAQRFGDNYLNDKRLFKGSTIAMRRLVATAGNLEVAVGLASRDKNPDVPNPMGVEIHAILTGGSDDE